MTKNPAYGNTLVNATLFANIAKHSVMIGLREYAPCGVSLASSSHLSSSTRIVVTSSSFSTSSSSAGVAPRHIWEQLCATSSDQLQSGQAWQHYLANAGLSAACRCTSQFVRYPHVSCSGASVNRCSLAA